MFMFELKNTESPQYSVVVWKGNIDQNLINIAALFSPRPRKLSA